MSLRAELYRGFQSQLVKPVVFPWFFSRSRDQRLKVAQFLAALNPTAQKTSPLGWFHAASVGELEMLVPIIEKWCALTTATSERAGAVVTIFSESAEEALGKFGKRLHQTGARVLFTGYSPWEGEWKNALGKVNPEFFVTARYEAWPELWLSLAYQEIPLVVVGAKTRASLTWAKRACLWLGHSIPEIAFCTVGEGDIAELRSEFPGTEISASGDPRWERVAQRAQDGNVRARELISAFSKQSKPWGVLGSVWPDDLKVWKPVLEKDLIEGTLWMVPHKIDEIFVKDIEAVLDSAGLSHVRSGAGLENGDQKTRCIVVNEMGFLAELYSAADWAYVGGGFNHGVHNTIEPAIHGIPVSCGPKRADRFPEIEILRSFGQLEKLAGSQDIALWLGKVGKLARERDQWKERARLQLGASDRVLRRLLSLIPGWKLHE
jgi:3-deoxy-D-manno-octulosonic-acid transferase